MVACVSTGPQENDHKLFGSVTFCPPDFFYMFTALRSFSQQPQKYQDAFKKIKKMKTLSQWDSFCSEDAPNVLDLLSRKIAHSFVGRMCFVFLIQKEVVYLPGSTRAAFVFFCLLRKATGLLINVWWTFYHQTTNTRWFWGRFILYL